MPVDALSVANFPIPAVPSTKVANWRGTGSTNGVIGAGGVIPSQWSMSGTGLSFEILGHGIDATTNVEYTDIRAFGTASGNIAYRLSFAPSTLIDCLYDQRYQAGFYLALLAGGTGLTNVTNHLVVAQFRQSNGTSISTGTTSIAAPDATFKLFTGVMKATGGANPVLIAKADPEYQFSVANGLTIDYRFRIGYPIGVLAQEAGIGFPLMAQPITADTCYANGVRNPTASGGATGTPGTAPTNWNLPGAAAGLTRQIVAFPTVDGIPCIDVRYFGTQTSGSGAYAVIFDNSQTQIAITAGELARQTVFIALLNGPNILTSLNHDIVEYPLGFDNTSSNILSQIGQGLKEFTFITGTPHGTTQFIQPRISVSNPNGVAMDVTYRFGAPRCNRAEMWKSIVGPDLAQNAALGQKHVLVALALNNSSPVFGQPGIIYLLVLNAFEAADSAAFVVVFEGQRSDAGAVRSGSIMRPSIPDDIRPITLSG